MYGFPSSFDPSVFVGCELVQVSFSANTINLSFEHGLDITVQGRLEVEPTSGSEAFTESAGEVAFSALPALVGRRVSKAIGEVNGTLTLEFDTGARVLCLEDSEQYECYTIRANGKEFVV